MYPIDDERENESKGVCLELADLHDYFTKYTFKKKGYKEINDSGEKCGFEDMLNTKLLAASATVCESNSHVLYNASDLL